MDWVKVQDVDVVVEMTSSQTIHCWVILGDCNTLITVEDRTNGAPVHINETTYFQNCIDDLGLGQITRRCCDYSWCNIRDVAKRIYNHIDESLEM